MYLNVKVSLDNVIATLQKPLFEAPVCVPYHHLWILEEK